jgi:hypothetical protein
VEVQANIPAAAAGVGTNAAWTQHGAAVAVFRADDGGWLRGPSELPDASALVPSSRTTTLDDILLHSRALISGWQSHLEDDEQAKASEERRSEAMRAEVMCRRALAQPRPKAIKLIRARVEPRGVRPTLDSRAAATKLKR